LSTDDIPGLEAGFCSSLHAFKPLMSAIPCPLSFKNIVFGFRRLCDATFSKIEAVKKHNTIITITTVVCTSSGQGHESSRAKNKFAVNFTGLGRIRKEVDDEMKTAAVSGQVNSSEMLLRGQIIKYSEYAKGDHRTSLFCY